MRKKCLLEEKRRKKKVRMRVANNDTVVASEITRRRELRFSLQAPTLPILSYPTRVHTVYIHGTFLDDNSTCTEREYTFSSFILHVKGSGNALYNEEDKNRQPFWSSLFPYDSRTFS
jgi:hypothetical protein